MDIVHCDNDSLLAQAIKSVLNMLRLHQPLTLTNLG